MKQFSLLPLILIIILLSSSLAQAHVETVIIKMTENGFEPREVTVDENTIINFVNKDTVSRWPASNVHPTHELYSEFDPKKPVEAGNFWIFKPKRTGTWKYHDHLFPHKRGTITVVPEEDNQTSESDATEETEDPPSSQATEKETSWRTRLKNTLRNLWQAIIRPFKNGDTSATGPAVLSTSNFQALSEQDQYDHLKQMSETEDLATTWEYVKSSYTNDAGAALGGRAHDLAHFTGELMHNEKGLEGLSLCDTTFAFGCYHGFTEAAFATSLDPLQEVSQACAKLGPISSGPWASCIHGIGHGVATFFDAVELENALSTCDEIEGATYCHDGVFMEFSFSAPPNFYKENDPLYPCSELDDQYLQACGRNQPHVMQRKFNLSRANVAKLCQKTTNQGMIAACIDAIGFGIANESQGNVQTITSQCKVLTDPQIQAQCVSAAAGELVFQNYPNWQQSAPAACNSLPPEFQADCHNRFQQTAQNYQR